MGKITLGSKAAKKKFPLYNNNASNLLVIMLSACFNISVLIFFYETQLVGKE